MSQIQSLDLFGHDPKEAALTFEPGTYIFTVATTIPIDPTRVLKLNGISIIRPEGEV